MVGCKGSAMRFSLPRYCQQHKFHFYVNCWTFFFCSNIAGQWNPVFIQSLPEEEIVIRDDQDPRVSNAKVLIRRWSTLLIARRTNSISHNSLSGWLELTEAKRRMHWLLQLKSTPSFSQGWNSAFRGWSLPFLDSASSLLGFFSSRPCPLWACILWT